MTSLINTVEPFVLSGLLLDAVVDAINPLLLDGICTTEVDG